MERRWVKGECIGKGSFGTVSLALNPSNGRIFAVKSINLNSSPPRAAAALEAEIRLLSSLNSPHIVSYLGDDITEDSAGGRRRNLHLEYLPGGTATDLAAATAIEERDLRSHIRSVARALRYLHATAGVVHGDVKGRNVLLGSAPAAAAKLADFGSARRVFGGSAAKGGGTPLWMSPEVARGEAATPASDVWSLGCTVIEMANGGRQPWGELGLEMLSRDQYVQMYRIGFWDVSPEIPRGLSKLGRDFVEKCMRREPGERWTCEQLLQHSFVVDSAEPSPRSVLDLGGMEIEFEEDEDEDEDGERCEENASAEERIRELASSEANWGSDGWVEVRAAENYCVRMADVSLCSSSIKDSHEAVVGKSVFLKDATSVIHIFVFEKVRQQLSYYYYILMDLVVRISFLLEAKRNCANSLKNKVVKKLSRIARAKQNFQLSFIEPLLSLWLLIDVSLSLLSARNNFSRAAEGKGRFRERSGVEVCNESWCGCWVGVRWFVGLCGALLFF